MKAVPDRLPRHLAVAIVLKLLVLVLLWWAFVRDARVDVDVDRASAHLGQPADAPHPASAISGVPP